MSPAALERAAAIEASGRHIPAFFDLPTAIDNSRQEPDLQHPVGRDALPDGRAAGLDERPGRPRPAMVERTTASSDALYGWAEKTAYTTPYVADPDHRSLVIGTIDFDDADRRRRDRRRPCAPTGSSTPSPTASSAATSCGSRCTPPSTPPTSRPSPPASTTSSSTSDLCDAGVVP